MIQVYLKGASTEKRHINLSESTNEISDENANIFRPCPRGCIYFGSLKKCRKIRTKFSQN
jgi:uncharacterized protein YutD